MTLSPDFRTSWSQRDLHLWEVCSELPQPYRQLMHRWALHDISRTIRAELDRQTRDL
jgi:hypothetical protein